MAGNIVGRGAEGAPTIVVETRRAVTSDIVRNAMKPQSYQKDLKIEELKEGDYTIYDPTFRFAVAQPGANVIHGQAFVVVGNNIILESRNIEGLRKILQRGKPAEMSETMQAALKNVDGSKTVACAVDLKAVMANAEIAGSEGRLPAILADNAETLKQCESLAVNGNLSGDDAVLRRDARLQGRPVGR